MPEGVDLALLRSLAATLPIQVTVFYPGTLTYWLAWRPVVTVDRRFAWFRYVLRDSVGRYYD